MSAQLKSIIDGILRVEGSKYTNHPSDRGGPTKYGITLQTLGEFRRRQATADDVKNLTESEARSIYTRRYIEAPRFDDVTKLHGAVGHEIVDAGVLSGPARAAMWLQAALNALNRQERDYPDVLEDGAVGARTLDALGAYLNKRGADGATVLLRALNCQQGQHFLTISRNRKADEDFVFGWLLHRVAMR